MMQIYDLSDPAKPVFIRNFGLPGQEPGAKGPAPSEVARSVFHRAARAIAFTWPTDTARDGVIEILDREKLLNGPKEPTEENLHYPHIARVDLPDDVGAHTTFPLLGRRHCRIRKNEGRPSPRLPRCSRRNLANECQESRQMMHFFDITHEATPIGVSTWTVPEDSGNFCSRGGRFGTHSTNENLSPVFYNRVLFVAHFNAGVRAVDIRDPFHPTEIGYYIPAITDKTDKRCVGAGADQNCKMAIQTNNVEVDDRGYIYIVDRANTGMHILQLTGPARAVANLP